MSKIRVSYEEERGCGFRKKGGLYLIGGPLSAPCGKLPLAVHKCPTCGGGIPQSRSWKWIKPQDLFGAPSTCVTGQLGGKFSCATCPVGLAMPERAGLLWIGEKFYETPDIFLNEARRLGISKRITHPPKGFKPGETAVFLAHPKVPLMGPDNEPGPAIFAVFFPKQIEKVVDETCSDEEADKLRERGIEPVIVKPKGVTEPLFPDQPEARPSA